MNMWGFGLVELKSEGTSTGYDGGAMRDTGEASTWKPMSLEEMIAYADQCAEHGYFEIGPENARALAGYLRLAARFERDGVLR